MRLLRTLQRENHNLRFRSKQAARSHRRTAGIDTTKRKTHKNHEQGQRLMGRPKLKEKKDAQIVTRVKKFIRKKMEQIAKRKGIKLSEASLEAFKMYVEANG